MKAFYSFNLGAVHNDTLVA